MNNKVAVIDLGTNTFHLLIAQDNKALYKDERTVKLGEGGISQGIISEAAMERGITTLTTYKKVIDSYEVVAIYAFGTSALRNARNADVFINQVQQQLGFTIEVIDGKKEAEFIYQGVLTSGLLQNEPSLIMDIGGGSVEFIIGTKTDLIWRKSYELGAQRLLDKFVHSDPISVKDQNIIDEYFTTELADLSTQIEANAPVKLIGSSGTFHTLTHMLLGKKMDSPVQIENPMLDKLFVKILVSTHNERLEMAGIPKGREDMIVPASLLVRFMLRKGKFDGFSLSPFSMKEGILSSLAG
ncbi:MAG: phosphatase [Cyclobacteriaceae bacterium]|nr:phosphatase [Cyclobacteriaceae bacterium]